MAVNEIDIQQGERYTFTSNKGKYTVSALGLDEILYPSYMSCVILSIRSLQASKRSRLLDSKATGYGLEHLWREALNSSWRLLESNKDGFMIRSNYRATKRRGISNEIGHGSAGGKGEKVSLGRTARGRSIIRRREE